MPALCVCGLAAEAGIARVAGFDAVAGGGDPARTRARIAAALPRPKSLISFGIAGGLDPDLPVGGVILSGEVIADDGHWRADGALDRHIAWLAREIGAITGPVLGAGRIIATADDKARARAETGALAVDLESAIVARAAVAAGIPFLVLRAVADPASRRLPAAALAPLRSDGKPSVSRVLASVLGRPRQLPELFTVARETRAALAALLGAARVLRGLLDRT